MTWMGIAALMIAAFIVGTLVNHFITKVSVVFERKRVAKQLECAKEHSRVALERIKTAKRQTADAAAISSNAAQLMAQAKELTNRSQEIAELAQKQFAEVYVLREDIARVLQQPLTPEQLATLRELKLIDEQGNLLTRTL